MQTPFLQELLGQERGLFSSLLKAHLVSAHLLGPPNHGVLKSCRPPRRGVVAARREVIPAFHRPAAVWAVWFWCRSCGGFRCFSEAGHTLRSVGAAGSSLFGSKMEDMRCEEKTRRRTRMNPTGGAPSTSEHEG